MDKKTVWIVEIDTESADHYLHVFSEMPNHQVLKRLAMQADDLQEDDPLDGYGYAGTSALLSFEEYEVDSDLEE